MNTGNLAYMGTNEEFYWIQSPRCTLEWLVESCPGIFVSKYIAVTACDSGPMRLSDTELANGWHVSGLTAYSPKVANVRDLYWAGYDEWYILPEPHSLGIQEVFVNFGGFGLINPWRQFTQDLDPTWDRRIHEGWAATSAARIDRFWGQMRESGAESYVADGDNLLLVTQNQEHHNCVQAAMEAKGILVQQDK